MSHRWKGILDFTVTEIKLHFKRPFKANSEIVSQTDDTRLLARNATTKRYRKEMETQEKQIEEERQTLSKTTFQWRQWQSVEKKANRQNQLTHKLPVPYPQRTVLQCLRKGDPLMILARDHHCNQLTFACATSYGFFVINSAHEDSSCIEGRWEAHKICVDILELAEIQDCVSTFTTGTSYCIGHFAPF